MRFSTIKRQFLLETLDCPFLIRFIG